MGQIFADFFGRFKRKPILIIAFAFLIMTFLVSVVVTNYLPKSYPNLIRLYSTTFTSGDVELRSDYPQWRVGANSASIDKKLSMLDF